MPEAKILIVDDDQDIRRLLGHRLKTDGYETVFAADAISAVNLARKEEPDLILLDLGLPAGDGYVVMERLKAMPALEDIKIIIVTARDVRVEQETAALARRRLRPSAGPGAGLDSSTSPSHGGRTSSVSTRSIRTRLPTRRHPARTSSTRTPRTTRR